MAAEFMLPVGAENHGQVRSTTRTRERTVGAVIVISSSRCDLIELTSLGAATRKARPLGINRNVRLGPVDCPASSLQARALPCATAATWGHSETYAAR